MAPMKYYGLGPRGAKALITANFAGVSIESVPVEMGVTNKTPEYLAMCPTGKVRSKAEGLNRRGRAGNYYYYNCNA